MRSVSARRTISLSSFTKTFGPVRSRSHVKSLPVSMSMISSPSLPSEFPFQPFITWKSPMTSGVAEWELL